MPSFIASLEQLLKDWMEDFSSSDGNNNSPSPTAFGVMALSTLLSLFLYWKERQRAKLLGHELQCLRIKSEMAENDKQRHQRELELEQRMAKLRAFSEGIDNTPKNETSTSTSSNNLPESSSSSSLVLHIVAPDILHIPQHEVLEEWRLFSASSLGTNSRKHHSHTNTTIVHVHFVLIHLVNRWIRQGRVGRSSIHMMSQPQSESTHIQLIVVNETLASTLVDELQHWGFGKRVGMVYATPILSTVLHMPSSTVNTSSSSSKSNDPHDSSNSHSPELLVAQPHVVRRVSNYLQEHDGSADGDDEDFLLQRRLSTLSQWTVGTVEDMTGL